MTPIKNLAFLCSGQGGNLRALHRLIADGLLPGYRIAGVLADRECGSLSFARAHGIPAERLDMKEGRWDAVLAKLQSFSPDIVFVFLHKILPPTLVAAFEGRLLNMHYSLLPAFAMTIGLNQVRAAQDYGSRLTGVTLHQITNAVDAGPPVVQVAVPMGPGDAPEAVMNVLFRGGVAALYGWLSQHPEPANCLKLAERTCLISPGASWPECFADEAFWNALAAA